MIIIINIHQGVTPTPGDPPEDMSDFLVTLLPDVVYDGTPPGSAFGDVVAQPYPLAYTGETVTAKFVSTLSSSI